MINLDGEYGGDAPIHLQNLNRNSLIPLMTLLGPLAVALMTGSLVVPVPAAQLCILGLRFPMEWPGATGVRLFRILFLRGLAGTARTFDKSPTDKKKKKVRGHVPWRSGSNE